MTSQVQRRKAAQAYRDDLEVLDIKIELPETR